MKAYLYDENSKEYIAEIEAQTDPLESKKAKCDIWLLPANSTFELPPPRQNGFKIIFEGDKWIMKELIQDNHIDNITEPLNNRQIKENRFSLYCDSVDPLMSEYLRKKTFNLFKEGEEAELLSRVEAAVAKIKFQNPYLTEEVSDA